MQIWDDLLIFFPISCSWIIVCIALPTAGWHFFVFVTWGKPSAENFAWSWHQETQVHTRKQQVNLRALLIILTPLPEPNLLYLQRAGLTTFACLLLVSALWFWARSTTSLSYSWLSGTPQLLSPAGRNDSGAYKGTMTLVSGIVFTEDRRHGETISFVAFCQLANVSFCGTWSIWMNVELNKARWHPALSYTRANMISLISAKSCTRR